MTARALLDRQFALVAADSQVTERLTDDEIREAISGQICRCTGYTTIVRSIRWAEEHPRRKEGDRDGSAIEG